MALLSGMSGDVAGQSFELDRDETSIGRSEDNTITLDDGAVSGNHCAVIREGDAFVLRDFGSTNGTRLNAQDVKEARLKPKDIISIGSVEFMFNSDSGIEADREEPRLAEVEVAPGPAAAPDSFDSISPFGARAPDTSKRWWYVLIVVVGLLALAAVVLLFVHLVTTV